MATDTAVLLEHLTAGLTDGLVLTGEACNDYRIQGQLPPIVALPTTVAEVSHLLRTANELGAAVTPWGAGTQQAMGQPPAALDLVLSLERLNNVLIHEPDDLTCSVQAGLRLGALNRMLAEHNQMLPLDPPLADTATIGGLIATNASGPRRHGYGTLRDLLIGISVVHTDGMISKSGGIVVKNVSGYDMAKLYLGSLGTVAVIVSANFKLVPRPPTQATAVAAFNDLAAATAVIEALLASQLVPTAIELLDGPAAAACGLDGSWATLAVQSEGTPAAVARTIRDVRALAVEHGAVRHGEFDAATSAAFWVRLADFGQVANLAADEAVLKLSVIPTDVPATLESLATTAEDQGLMIARMAHAGVGIVLVRVRPAAGSTMPFATALSAYQTALVERWRHVVVVGCQPQHKATLPLWGQEPSGLAVMRTLKSEFDPNGILNRGRFVGGI